MPELYNKYRPKLLKEVLGQNHLVKSFSSRIPHALLLTGGPGLGKTTIARIVALLVGCGSSNLVEIDAATYTGIEAMREVKASLCYKGFSSGGIKVVIVDECHQLSKSAFNSILKAIEEPQEHVYWILCTTDPSKVPRTIKTRCHAFTLKPLDADTLLLLLESVAKKEEIFLDNKSLKIIAKASGGSARQALVYLAMTSSCTDHHEVREVIGDSEITGNLEILALCKLLVSRGTPSWSSVKTVLIALKGQNPESIRIVVTNYINSCVLNASSINEANRFVDILDIFSKPCTPSDKLAPIILATFLVFFD